MSKRKPIVQPEPIIELCCKGEFVNDYGCANSVVLMLNGCNVSHSIGHLLHAIFEGRGGCDFEGNGITSAVENDRLSNNPGWCVGVPCLYLDAGADEPFTVAMFADVVAQHTGLTVKIHNNFRPALDSKPNDYNPS